MPKYEIERNTDIPPAVGKQDTTTNGSAGAQDDSKSKLASAAKGGVKVNLLMVAEEVAEEVDQHGSATSRSSSPARSVMPVRVPVEKRPTVTSTRRASHFGATAVSSNIFT